jgi:hypothetical protein
MKRRLRYTDILASPSRVLAMTGLTPEEFPLLSLQFDIHWQRRMQRITLENKARKRCYKPRKNSVLPSADDRLLFVLSYMKLNPLQEARGKVLVVIRKTLPLGIKRDLAYLDRRTDSNPA